MKSPNANITFCIWTASSLVGDKHKTWVSRTVRSKDCKIAIENVAVFPVPDWAWAITSRPLIIGLMERCWMADGFSKPERLRLSCANRLWPIYTVCEDSSHEFLFQIHVFKFVDHFHIFASFELYIGEVFKGRGIAGTFARHFFLFWECLLIRWCKLVWLFSDGNQKTLLGDVINVKRTIKHTWLVLSTTTSLLLLLRPNLHYRHLISK